MKVVEVPQVLSAMAAEARARLRSSKKRIGSRGSQARRSEYRNAVSSVAPPSSGTSTPPEDQGRASVRTSP